MTPKQATPPAEEVKPPVVSVPRTRNGNIVSHGTAKVPEDR